MDDKIDHELGLASNLNLFLYDSCLCSAPSLILNYTFSLKSFFILSVMFHLYLSDEYSPVINISPIFVYLF